MKDEVKKIVFYVLMILFFGSLMFFIAHEGALRHVVSGGKASVQASREVTGGFDTFVGLTLEHVRSSLGILLLQILVILVTCRIVGLLFKRLGQPTVIGEIMAGILLGPSVLGWFFPSVSSFLFPTDSLSNIQTLSQFGLILFMFTVGMELDINTIRKRWHDTILISHASTIVPFFLGMLVAYFIYGEYAEGIPFVAFALFVGISMSITAFPVLARIIQERKLTRTHLGSLSLASAANGDITAWCLLAAVVAYVQAGTMQGGLYNVLFSLVFIFLMFVIVRPLLRIVGDLYHNQEVVSKPLVALMFFILIASSYITEILGLHALFGAFVAGLVMPENMKFRKIMNDKVEDVSLTLFLPLFFVYTGLRTELGLLDGWNMWLLCGFFILVAIIGKFGGTMFAARVSNESWKNSLYMGALMNTRGLMELVVLSIGYEMGVLSPTIFAMLVVMTLATTFMTMPLLAFIRFCFKKSEKKKSLCNEVEKTDKYKVLLSFGRASNGQVMLDVAHQMFSEGQKQLDLTALHLTVGTDVNPLHTEDFEKVSFAPILHEAGKLGMSIQARYEVCENAERHICSMVNTEGFQFLLVGAGVSMSAVSTDVTAHDTWRKFIRMFKKHDSQKFIFYPGALIKDKTKSFIEQADCSVGVFVNRGFQRAAHILVVVKSKHDLVLLKYVKILQQSTHGSVQIVNLVNVETVDYGNADVELSNYEEKAVKTEILPERSLTRDTLRQNDFMLVSYASWQSLTEEHKDVLQSIPSTLIIRHKSKADGF